MIINFEKGILKFITEQKTSFPKEEFIESLNQLCNLSRSHHCVIISRIDIKYIIENFKEDLDKSSLKALSNLAARESYAKRTYLKTFPYYISLTVDERVTPIGEIKEIENVYFKGGHTFSIHLFSLIDTMFLGEKFSVISENITDVNFYEDIRNNYMLNNYPMFSNTPIRRINGEGHKIGDVIKAAAQEGEKIFVICDSDKKTPTFKLGNDKTLKRVEKAYKELRGNLIINMYSLKVHEKENLIPVSWMMKHSDRKIVCDNLVKLEQSEYKDRLLFIDFDKKTTKKYLEENPEIKDYLMPAIENIGIDINSISDDEQIFTRITKNSIEKFSKDIFKKESIEDLPVYLKDHVEEIGFHFSAWTFGGLKVKIS